MYQMLHNLRLPSTRGCRRSAAEWERRIIGQRTRDALATKRAQGVRLGRLRQLPGSIVDRIVAERDLGWSLRAIADGLNAKGVPTAHGGARWNLRPSGPCSPRRREKPRRHGSCAVIAGSGRDP